MVKWLIRKKHHAVSTLIGIRIKTCKVFVCCVIQPIFNLALIQELSQSTLGLVRRQYHACACRLFGVHHALHAAVKVGALLAHLLFQCRKLGGYVSRWAYWQCATSGFMKFELDLSDGLIHQSIILSVGNHRNDHHSDTLLGSRNCACCLRHLSQSLRVCTATCSLISA